MKVIGCIITCEHDDAIELRHMAILQDYQRNSTGSQLLGYGYKLLS